MCIPEAFGGFGLGPVWLVAMMEELGAALYCGPALSSACLAAPAILAAGTEDQKRALLPGVAAGTTRATLGWLREGWRDGAPQTGLVAEPSGAEIALTKAVGFVPDGHTAELLILAALDAQGLGLYAVPSGTAGLHRELQPSMDATRKLAKIRCSGARISRSARLGEGDATAALQQALDLGTIALAALDRSVAYVKERVQFGRPIGSFQAIKHKCADMLVALEDARSAAHWAGRVAAEEPERLGEAAASCRERLARAWDLLPEEAHGSAL